MVTKRKYPGEFLGFWVSRLAGAMRARLDQRTHEFDLGATEALLMTILRFKGASSLAELSNLLGLAHPSVLRHVDALEARNLVERSPHPKDRRIKVVTLTESGRSLERKINQVIAEVNAQAVSNMNLTEQTTLFALIRRAIQNVGGHQFMPPPQAMPPGFCEHAGDESA